ncbi:unnamed protein product, partial [Amoebophrya sp. A120]|eukprot:GSA120T00014789001.1
MSLQPLHREARRPCGMMNPSRTYSTVVAPALQQYAYKNVDLFLARLLQLYNTSGVRGGVFQHRVSCCRSTACNCQLLQGGHLAWSSSTVVNSSPGEQAGFTTRTTRGFSSAAVEVVVPPEGIATPAAAAKGPRT